MTTAAHPPRRRSSLPFAALVATASAALALALAGGHAAQGHADAAKRSGPSAKHLALHDEMRRLWEDHITWTRLFIVSAIAGLPDVDATAGRLLQNQDDIGAAIVPFYGEDAGQALSALLRDHILIAADLVAAAIAGDDAAVASELAAWYANGDEIAAFLAGANPVWPVDTLEQMMRTHLDQTLVEATARLQGDWTTDVAEYDTIVAHILEMADTLSAGVIEQFPNHFSA